MKKLMIAVLAACLSMISYAQEAPYVQGELIVMMEKGQSPAALVRSMSSMVGTTDAVKLESTLSDLSFIYLISFDSSLMDAQTAREKAAELPGVKAVQFNHFVQERETTPSDPGFGSQWHHVDASDNDIDSDLAWDITTGGTTANGDEIVVCVIEGGGANYNHTDLIANHWTNTAEIDGNGIDDDGNGFVDDVNGWNPVTGNDNVGTGNHGTAVSGMIGAKANNGIGGVGVNWDVKIMQVGLGSLTESNVIASYNYPYTMRNLYNTTNGAEGAFVVATNASWGIDNANPANYPVWCAYYDDLGAVGILNCGATANNNVNIDAVGDMPTGCSSDYMVAVTATNSSDVRTFSGYGANTIDLGAPGESVYLPSGSTGYANTSGTSFASPCVAGAIAMVYSSPCPDLAALALSNPQQAADMVRGYILNGVDPVPNLVGEVATGGRLNVRNSIDLALAACGPLPPCDPIAIAATAECYYNIGTAQVEASLVIDVTMSEAFCNAETVCYRPVGGSFVCDDLLSLGVTLDNNGTYTIYGLSSNQQYEVYFTTADGSSTTIVVTTGDCSNEVPGCTDPIASNYDPSATFDDGSCAYPCQSVTLSIDTDCWGGEVSWEVLDGTGTVIASVAGGTYGNQQNFTWTQCLDYGCYTFNIYDSFGDGLDGTASGCAVDGNYSMTAADGSVLFQMGVANYGSGTSHTFCLPTELPGCTNPVACNYNAGATIDDGSCVLPDGCTDPAACNYDPAATCDDGSCVLPDGCTDPAACNYDPAATCDDGSCDFLSCSCLGDFNNDQVINAADFLELLGEYACVSNCSTDMNGDGLVNAADVLAFLALFGTSCQ